MEIIGAIITLFGSFVLLVASIGLVRMPDVYNRLQVGTKATTLGTILSLVGLAFVVPGWTAKLILLIIFIMMTNPVSSHVLARVAYFIKIPFTSRTVTDKLKLSDKALRIEHEPK
ncbi:MAG: cation:proton antiporter [Bacteroidetes bacterium 4572_114]|nr:MAG: cation:proton antiporter [Bacteroidetes bacterium 4572_114]